jgi:MFS superfamily sulfate permease-like transporter
MLEWVSAHSGIPAIVLAAVLIVLTWRLVKWSAKLALEVALVAAILLVMTKLGWIRF